MERNWYAVYTKPNKEKKVIAALTKKGIKNYCPLNNTINKSKQAPEYRPLFSSYVFVYITEAELTLVKSIPYVSNFIYYKSQPVIIKRREVDLVKKMTASYFDIKLEKTSVNMEQMAAMDTVPAAFDYGNSDVMTLNYETVKVTLPSLGYLLTANVDQATESQFNRGFGLRNFIPGSIKNFRAN